MPYYSWAGKTFLLLKQDFQPACIPHGIGQYSTYM